MAVIRWGIIGCGNVTEVKSGPGFQKARNSQLVAVMRRDGALARDYAERHGVPRWYDDADALIHDPNVDAVYIATPPSSHQEYTLRAAAAGKPVYVEKPMGLNFAECEAMIQACRAANVPLYVAYYRRAMAPFLKVKELVTGGAIGEPRFVQITLHQPPAADLDGDALPWRVRPEIAGGGHFVDLGSHMLDFLDDVLGPIRDVAGFAARQAARYPAEDIVSSAFVFESGVQGVGTWCFTAYGSVDQTEIVGSAGKVAYATFDARPVVTLTTPDGVTEFPFEYPPHVQQPLIQTVVDDLNGEGRCPSTGESGARTTWVIDQMLRALRAAV